MDRRVCHEGMVSVAGNLYSVPDATRKRIVEVHTLANEAQNLRRRRSDRHASGSGGQERSRDRASRRRRAAILIGAPHRTWSPAPSTSTRPSRAGWPAKGDRDLEIVPSVLDRIRRTLVGLKMPRALEVLDQTVRQLERGETSALEVIDTLFAEELTLRENRRVKMALRMAQLALLDRLLHRAVVIQIEGSSYRLRQHADLMPEHVRSKALINAPIPAPPPRRRGRPPKNGAHDHAAG